MLTSGPSTRPVFQPVKVKEKEAVETLRGYNADIFVVAAFGQLLSEEILSMPKYGCASGSGRAAESSGALPGPATASTSQIFRFFPRGYLLLTENIPVSGVGAA